MDKAKGAGNGKRRITRRLEQEAQKLFKETGGTGRRWKQLMRIVKRRGQAFMRVGHVIVRLGGV